MNLLLQKLYVDKRNGFHRSTLHPDLLNQHNQMDQGTGSNVRRTRTYHERLHRNQIIRGISTHNPHHQTT